MRHENFIVQCLLAIVLSTTALAHYLPEDQDTGNASKSSQQGVADAAQSLPPLRLEEVTTWDELKRVLESTHDVTVRVVDRADNHAIAGVEVAVGFSAERIRTTDSNGIARFTSVKRRLGQSFRATVAEPVRGEQGRQLSSYASAYSPAGWKKGSQPVETNGLIVPSWVSAAPLGETVEPIALELGVRLDGVFRVGQLTFEQQSDFQHSLFFVVVPAEPHPHSFIVRPGAAQIRIGPTGKENTLAFFRISNSFTAFDLRDNFSVHVVVERPVYNISVGMRNRMKFRHAGHLTDWIEDNDGFGIDYLLIRLSDARIFGSRAAHDDADPEARKGQPVPFPAGQYAIVPGAFSGTKFHLAFFHAVREGIDLAQFGVPIITLNEANPRAELTIDAMEFIDIRRRVEQALKDKRARDAAANPVTTPEAAAAVPAPAPAPKDPTDEPPAPPTP